MSFRAEARGMLHGILSLVCRGGMFDSHPSPQSRVVPPLRFNPGDTTGRVYSSVLIVKHDGSQWRRSHGAGGQMPLLEFWGGVAPSKTQIAIRPVEHWPYTNICIRRAHQCIGPTNN